MMTDISNSDRKDYSQLDYTYGLLSGLTEEELNAVQAVIIAFLNKNMTGSILKQASPFKPQTEEQLFARIDHSLGQIEAGLVTDSEEFEKEMLAGIPE